MIPDPWYRQRREMFPVCDDWIYLDHAGVAPLCGPAAAAMGEVVGDFRDRGAVGYGAWLERERAARNAAARILGTEPRRVAWVPNTSAGLSIAAAGYDWQPGDKVVLATDEFPSNVYPWLALIERGVEVLDWDPGASDDEALANLERLLAGHDRIRMVATSWVQYHTGRILPIVEAAARAREAGTLMIVDGIQGLGLLACRFDGWGIDLMAADGHKWLLGPEGLGIAAVSDRAMELLRPAAIGWHTVADPFPFDRIDWTPAPDARRYEPGTWNLAGIAGLHAAMETLLEARQPAIRAHVAGLLGRIWDGLGLTPPDYPVAGHAFVPLAGRLGRDALLDRGIVSQVRGGRLRLSPHAYIADTEIERVVAAVDELRRAEPA